MKNDVVLMGGFFKKRRVTIQGGEGVKNRKNLTTSFVNAPFCAFKTTKNLIFAVTKMKNYIRLPKKEEFNALTFTFDQFGSV